MSEEDVMAKLKGAIINYDTDAAVSAAKEVVEVGIDPVDAIEKGLAEGIKVVGERFERFEVFLPHLVIASDIMVAAIKVLEPVMEERKLEMPVVGKVVIGTVKGDIHDIGKSIVATMLRVSGFEVHDLGVDVPDQEFINTAKKMGADIIAVSALLTSSMLEQRDIIKELERMGLREKFKVLIGGGAVTEKWAEEVGADGYAQNAIEAVRVAKALVGKE